MFLQAFAGFCRLLQVTFSLNRKRVSNFVKNKAMVSYTSYHIMFYHVFQDRGNLFWWHAIIINLCSQDEVHLMLLVLDSSLPISTSASFRTGRTIPAGAWHRCI